MTVSVVPALTLIASGVVQVILPPTPPPSILDQIGVVDSPVFLLAFRRTRCGLLGEVKLHGPMVEAKYLRLRSKFALRIRRSV